MKTGLSHTRRLGNAIISATICRLDNSLALVALDRLRNEIICMFR